MQWNENIELWAELWVPKMHMLKSELLVSQNVTILGDSVFKEVMKAKIVFGVGPNPIWPMSL